MSKRLNLSLVVLVPVVAALALVAFLKLHDAAGCAAQNLPLLKWQVFRTCAATH